MTVVVTSKTDLVVPKSVRRKAGIKSGDRVAFVVSKGIITIRPEPPQAEETFTPDEITAIEKARREMREGKYVTLAELEHDLARARPSRRRKAT